MNIKVHRPWAYAFNFGAGGGGYVNRPAYMNPGERAQVNRLLNNQPITATGPELLHLNRLADQIRKSGGAPYQIVAQVDLARLARALRDIDLAGKSKEAGVYRALNHTAGKLKTWLKRKLVGWVGLNRVKPADDALIVRHAGPGHLTAAVIVKDKFPAITAQNFGATWNRSMPGASHRAWGRQQIAQGAFMIPGRKPIFHRVGRGRLPIKPVFGPNYAREVERHAKEVTAQAESMMKVDFFERLKHELGREVARVKSQHRL